MSSQVEYYQRMTTHIPATINELKHYQYLMTEEGYKKARQNLEKCFELIK